MNEETWTCARCGRQSREDEALAWWDLVDDDSTEDPEEMPTVCPDCLYTPEERSQIAEALRNTSIEDAAEHLAHRE